VYFGVHPHLSKIIGLKEIKHFAQAMYHCGNKSNVVISSFKRYDASMDRRDIKHKQLNFIGVIKTVP
jgi:hypothetical protein